MVRVDSLEPGEKITVIHKGSWRDFVEHYYFLGITRPGDIYGRGAERGEYKPLPPKVAKRIWAGYLGCKPSWKSIDEAIARKYRNGEIEYGDQPNIVVKNPKTGEIGAYYYLYKGRWVWGSGARPIQIEEGWLEDV